MAAIQTPPPRRDGADAPPRQFPKGTHPSADDPNVLVEDD
jgi:hypothetical protein